MSAKRFRCNRNAPRDGGGPIRQCQWVSKPWSDDPAYETDVSSAGRAAFQDYAIHVALEHDHGLLVVDAEEEV